MQVYFNFFYMNTFSKTLRDEDSYNLSQILTSLAAINLEVEQKIEWGFFSIEYVREKLEKADTALRAIEYRDTINTPIEADEQGQKIA